MHTKIDNVRKCEYTWHERERRGTYKYEPGNTTPNRRSSHLWFHLVTSKVSNTRFTKLNRVVPIMTSTHESQPTMVLGDLNAIEAEDLDYNLVWLDPYKDTEYAENVKPPRFDEHSEIEVIACHRVLDLISAETDWDLAEEVVILTKSEKQKEVLEEDMEIPNNEEGVTVIPVCTLQEWGNEKRPVVIFSFGECMFDEDKNELVNKEACDDGHEVLKVLDSVEGYCTRLMIVGHKEYASKLSKYWKTVADMCSEHIIETYN